MGITQIGYIWKAKKLANFVGQIMRSFRESPQVRITLLYIIRLIHKKFEAGLKVASHFSQATHNPEHCWVTNNIIYLQ